MTERFNYEALRDPEKIDEPGTAYLVSVVAVSVVLLVSLVYTFIAHPLTHPIDPDPAMVDQVLSR